MSEEEPSKGGLPVSPETLVFGLLGLSVVVVLGLSTENQRLRRENVAIRANYQGLTEVHNASKGPCQDCAEKAVTNGDPRLHSTETSDSTAESS